MVQFIHSFKYKCINTEGLLASLLEFSLKLFVELFLSVLMINHLLA